MTNTDTTDTTDYVTLAGKLFAMANDIHHIASGSASRVRAGLYARDTDEEEEQETRRAFRVCEPYLTTGQVREFEDYASAVTLCLSRAAPGVMVRKEGNEPGGCFLGSSGRWCAFLVDHVGQDEDGGDVYGGAAVWQAP